MTKPNTATPTRMETIAAYIFQNENLLREALIMYHDEKTQHCQNEGAAQLASTGKFSDLYITHDGYLSANSTSDFYIDWGSHCVYCGNNYVNRIKNINCHLHVKLVDDPAKIWIDLYNHLIPIAEAYHNDGIPAEPSADKLPVRRESPAASLLYDNVELGNMIRWFRRSEKGSPEGKERRLINNLLFSQGVKIDNYGSVLDIEDADAEMECTVCGAARSSRGGSVECCTADKLASSTHPAWIKAHNALLNIAEHYHAFTTEQNAAPMGVPTTEKESPNTEPVEASESKTTTTYICGRCDTEHTSMTSAAMCCPDVDVMHTCNECGLHYDYRAEADYCCSSVKTEYHHPCDYDTMLYACRTCGTIPFGKLEGGEQRTSADQHCNPMNEK